jgi:hypothetical protein
LFLFVFLCPFLFLFLDPPNIEDDEGCELYEFVSYPDPEDDDELLEDEPVSDQIEHKEYAPATPIRNPAIPYFVVDCKLDKEYELIILYIGKNIILYFIFYIIFILLLLFLSVWYMYYYFYIYQYQNKTNKNESSLMFYH